MEPSRHTWKINLNEECISRHPSRKEQAHSNEIIGRAFNKGTLCEGGQGVSNPQASSGTDCSGLRYQPCDLEAETLVQRSLRTSGRRCDPTAPAPRDPRGGSRRIHTHPTPLLPPWHLLGLPMGQSLWEARGKRASLNVHVGGLPRHRA